MGTLNHKPPSRRDQLDAVRLKRAGNPAHINPEEDALLRRELPESHGPVVTRGLLAEAGRGHDDRITMINAREAALLKKRGGSGKPNPTTGLLSFDDSDDDGNTGNTSNAGENTGGMSGAPGSGVAGPEGPGTGRGDGPGPDGVGYDNYTGPYGGFHDPSYTDDGARNKMVDQTGRYGPYGAIGVKAHTPDPAYAGDWRNEGYVGEQAPSVINSVLARTLGIMPGFNYNKVTHAITPGIDQAKMAGKIMSLTMPIPGIGLVPGLVQKFRDYAEPRGMKVDDTYNEKTDTADASTSPTGTPGEASGARTSDLIRSAEGNQTVNPLNPGGIRKPGAITPDWSQGTKAHTDRGIPPVVQNMLIDYIWSRRGGGW